MVLTWETWRYLVPWYDVDGIICAVLGCCTMVLVFLHCVTLYVYTHSTVGFSLAEST